MWRRSFCCWMIMLSAAVAAGAEPLESELIFPLEKWHNHSSCLVEAPDGSLLACWYHGSGERKADDVLIEGARQRSGQKDWTPRFLLADTPGYPDCNPTLHVDSQQRLWLFWPTIIDHHWESALLKYRRADQWSAGDGAPRWDWQDVLHVTPPQLSEKLLKALDDLPAALKLYPQFAAEMDQARDRAGQELYLRLGWMPRAHATSLGGSRWILPLYCDTFSISLMAITNDDGETWQFSSPLIGFGNIQPSIVARRDGSLVAMMRENGITRRIRISESTDGGLNWGPVGQMDLPNSGSGLEVIRLADESWALIYNDTAQGRHQLAVSLSDDDGKTWPWKRYLENDSSKAGKFHYPSIIQTRDGALHATYSYHVEAGGAIKHARFSSDWVKEETSQGERPAK